MNCRWASFFIFCLIFSSISLRGEERSPLLFSFEGGILSPFSPSDFSSSHGKGRRFSSRLGYQISDQWAAGGQFSKQDIPSRLDSSQDVRMTPLLVWVQRDFPWTRLWTPYFFGSAGISRNKSAAFSNDDSRTGWVAGLSLGMTFHFSEMQDLSLELGAQHFSRASTENKGIQCIRGGLVLRFFLPESWVPLAQTVDISEADLEIPLVSDQPEEEIDPTFLAQEELERLQKEIETGRLPPIRFDAGSAILQTSSFEALDTLGAILRRYPEVRIRIYGFVEKDYTGETRDALAVARAQVVGTYVVQNFYLDESRFVFVGPHPVSTSATGQRDGSSTEGRIQIETISRH